MTTLQKLEQELLYAQEGLEQIHQAWRDGEYNNDRLNFTRDCDSAVRNITKLENQIDRESAS